MNTTIESTEEARCMDGNCDCCDDSCDYDRDDMDSVVRVGMPVPDADIHYFDPMTGKDKETMLSDFRGKWLVLCFYPADFTFVCPTELVDLAEHYEAFKKEGAEVFSVSGDTVFAHKQWHDTSDSIKKVKYGMISDVTHDLMDLFDVEGEDGLAQRGSFIIDPEGILRVAIVHDSGIGRSATELLRVLQAAAFVHKNGDKVCPAAWEPGQETITPGMDLVGKI